MGKRIFTCVAEKKDKKKIIVIIIIMMIKWATFLLNLCASNVSWKEVVFFRPAKGERALTS